MISHGLTITHLLFLELSGLLVWLEELLELQFKSASVYTLCPTDCSQIWQPHLLKDIST